MEYADVVLEVTQKIGEPAFELLVQGHYASALVWVTGGGLIGFAFLTFGLFSFIKGLKEDIEPLAALGFVISIIAFVILITTVGSFAYLVEPEGMTAMWLVSGVLK